MTPDDRRPAHETLILLMGNPNVGKSAVFSRLTGARVVVSNYPGTTVEFTEGRLRLDETTTARVVDVPGTYSLEPTNRAEEVAVEVIDKASVIVNVLDATNLERNLNLTLALVATGKPVLCVLNMWDEATARGVEIDVAKLEEMLTVPVVTTCALSGEGMLQLRQRLAEARPGTLRVDEGEKWHRIGDIVDAVQHVTHRHPTFGEKLSHLSVHPLWGPLFALAVLYASFEVVRFIGEGLIRWVFEPLFNEAWLPVMRRLSDFLGPGAFLHDLVIGHLVDGKIDFQQSFGLLTSGLYIPIAAVLPYICAFYLVLSLLEDIGYLPRLGVLVDNVMHRLGLHGLSIVPMMLGLGCNVPGVLAARVLETRKERFIALTLLSICVPCMAQTAVIAGLLGPYGALGFLPVFATLLVVGVVLGSILKRVVRGETPEILIDIPPYRMPYWKSLIKKLWMRVRAFLREAMPFVLLGVLFVNLMHTLGVLQMLGTLFGPLVTRVLGLPPGAVGALLVGFLRKDVAVGMLAPLGLNVRQLIVASLVLTMYFPCVAAFVMMFRELGWRDMLKASGIMLVT
ncbi:MAG TPA: ferrous iron transporter B, partial [Planctomycetota bacterium]|nr:ferrous iron transporter B [Planctomycetota bacterium]